MSTRVMQQLQTGPDEVDVEVIDDEPEQDDEPPHVSYDITSYGADFDVLGLVRRLEDGSIVIPEWQRSFLWPKPVASSFVESLLLGLPVPGIFLGLDPVSKVHYVIDGQQRLRTLQYFLNGRFRAGERESEFKLQRVSSRFEGKTYESLGDETRRELNDSLIHATIVRQDAPRNDDTSMCEVFRRLNTGGRIVNPQEIRCAIYRGPLIDRLKQLNQEPAWRHVLGRPSARLRDEEMILRFFAMWHSADTYRKPMSEFLDTFTARNRDAGGPWLEETSGIFLEAIRAFADAKGRGAFRIGRPGLANAALIDSMMIGLARRIASTDAPSKRAIEATHDGLIADDEYLEFVTRGTSDETAVAGRLDLATATFRDAE